MATDSGFGRSYQRLRSGKAFLFLLSGFCFVWVAWNWIPGVPHFDAHDLPLLVFVLSIEASLGLSAYGAVNERWRRADEEWQKRVDAWFESHAERDAESAEVLRMVHSIAQRQAETMEAMIAHLSTPAGPGPRAGVDTPHSEGARNA